VSLLEVDQLLLLWDRVIGELQLHDSVWRCWHVQETTVLQGVNSTQATWISTSSLWRLWRSLWSAQSPFSRYTSIIHCTLDSAPTTVTPFLLAVHVGGGSDAGAGRSLKTEDYSYHADALV
jgi:hypothetical protein